MLESEFPDEKFPYSVKDVAGRLQSLRSRVSDREDVIQEVLRYMSQNLDRFGAENIGQMYEFVLNAIRRRLMSKSMSDSQRRKKLAPEPEEEGDPGFDIEDLTGALDDKAAIKQFMDLIEEAEEPW